MLERMVERRWHVAGADAVTHGHMRCYGCMQAELGWRSELRKAVYYGLLDGILNGLLLAALLLIWHYRRRDPAVTPQHGRRTPGALE